MIDVCLILEGTYPYITGGVANWVDAPISGLSEFDFSLVHLTVRDGPERVQVRPPDQPAGNSHYRDRWLPAALPDSPLATGTGRSAPGTGVPRLVHRVRPQECYAGLDAMVLTSRSEGQPSTGRNDAWTGTDGCTRNVL